MRGLAGGRGCLYLVVGPSGAGKDSVIDALRAEFGEDECITFPRRYVTREGDAGGEVHHVVTESQFEELVQADRFALHWSAHGHRYGIPSDITTDLDAGIDVVVNVSRAIIPEARQRLQPTCVLLVNAEPEVLRSRLTRRGRASDGDLEARLKRADEFEVLGDDVVLLPNNGALSQPVATAAAVIRARHDAVLAD